MSAPPAPKRQTRRQASNRPAVGQSRSVVRSDGTVLAAEVLEVDEAGACPRYYVHYLAHDRRLDEWVDEAQFHGSEADCASDGSPAKRSHKRKQEGSGGNAAFGQLPHARRAGETDPSVAERLEAARVEVARRRVEEDAWVESAKDGLLMFASFVVFGTAPLVGYLLTPLFVHDPSEHDLFLAACAVTGVTLFSLGAAKARFVQQKALKLGAETLALGALCASVAYFCGAALSSQLPSH